MARYISHPRDLLDRLKPFLWAFVAAMLFVGIAPRPATAAGEGFEALFDALRLGDMVAVLSEEGRDVPDDFEMQGSTIPRTVWIEMLEALYNGEAMERAFEEELSVALDGADLAPMVEFYQSDLGQKIVQLELDARRAMSGEGAQDMASEAWAVLDPESARARLIEDYVEVYDLVEMNVAGAMTSDYAYLSALSQAGAGPEEMLSDEDILREIWAYEPDVRAEVSEWVYGFSTLAYEPLSDDEFSDFLDFARTQAGQKLNYALFAAFDAVYADISGALGAGTAQLLSRYGGQEL